MLNTIPGMSFVYKLVPGTPAVGATEPLPPTLRFKPTVTFSVLFIFYIESSLEMKVLTLGVQLRAIHVLPTMESDDLMANDVVARSKFGGKDSRDLEVVLDERVCNPSSWADDGRLRDLGPAESTGRQSGAVACSEEVISKSACCTGPCRGPTVARRDVVDNRPLVAIRPGKPLKLNGVSRIDVSVETSRSGTLVAVHVRCAGRCGLDETDVLVQRIPACSLGAAVL